MKKVIFLVAAGAVALAVRAEAQQPRKAPQPARSASSQPRSATSQPRTATSQLPSTSTEPRSATSAPRSTVTMRLQRPALAGDLRSNGDLAAESTDSLAQMTPEIWFYQQEMRRYEDPKAAVRRKAEFRAWQRQRRIAAMDWYGFSNARPTANPTPWSGVYGPGWVSNNYRHPYEWSGAGRTSVIYGSLR